MIYNQGDKVWIIPGFSGDALLTIECTITEIDDHFRKIYPEACLFYWVDEPTGHSLGTDDFYTREEAIIELQERYKLAKAYNMGAKDTADLIDNRRRTLRFIINTHRDIPKHEVNLLAEKELKKYPEKKYGEQWLNVKSVMTSE